MILAANEEGLPDCAAEIPEEKVAASEPKPVIEPEPVVPEKTNSPAPTGGASTSDVPSGRSGRGGRGGNKRPDDPDQGVLPLIWITIKQTALKLYDDMNKAEE